MHVPEEGEQDDGLEKHPQGDPELLMRVMEAWEDLDAVESEADLERVTAENNGAFIFFPFWLYYARWN